MINLKQRGRSGMQFLGSLQKFSSSVLRDQAEADYAAQPEAPAPLKAGASGWAVNKNARLLLQAGFQPLLQTFFTAETSLLSDDLAIFDDHDLRNTISGSVVRE